MAPAMLVIAGCVARAAQTKAMLVVRGQVVDSASGQPLAGAVIQVVGANVSARADSRGLFLLRLPRPTSNRLQLKACSIGFFARTLSTTVSEDSVKDVGVVRLPLSITQPDDLIIIGPADTTRAPRVRRPVKHP